MLSFALFSALLVKRILGYAPAKLGVGSGGTQLVALVGVVGVHKTVTFLRKESFGVLSLALGQSLGQSCSARLSLGGAEQSESHASRVLGVCGEGTRFVALVSGGLGLILVHVVVIVHFVAFSEH